jgi:hypothetical protein
MTARHTGSPKSAWYILFSSLTLIHSVSQEELMGADLLVCKAFLAYIGLAFPHTVLSACCLLYVHFVLGLLFNVDNGGKAFF